MTSHRCIRYFLALFCAFCFSLSLHAAPVWKISKGDEHLYLGGTVHLLSQADYPLPEAFNSAYRQADLLVFETDIAAMSTPAFQQKSMQMMTFSDGTTLADVLSADTLKAVETHLAERNIPMQNMMAFKPSLLYITLTIIELQRIGLTSVGVDQYFATLSMGDGKPHQWLETPDEQLAFLADLGKGEEDSLIAYTLRDLEELPDGMNKLKTAWREGDMQRLAEIGLEEMRIKYPDIYHDLLTRRNLNWLPQIKSMLKTPETEFVLVGALHLAGPDSVLIHLQKAGYKVQQLSGG